MKNTYEEEMFQFLTTDENFDSMWKVAAQLEEIKRKLIHNFWQAVMNELKVRSSTMNDKWEVVRVGKYLSDPKTKIMLFKSEWGVTGEDRCPQIGISFQNLAEAPFYGPFINNYVKRFNLEDVRERLHSQPIAEGFTHTTTWYPFYRNLDLFKGIDDFRSLLPHNVNSKVKDALKNYFYWQKF